VTRFVEEAIEKAGLLPVLAAHRAGDLEVVRASMPSWSSADLLVIGAVADMVRAEDVGETVQVHSVGVHEARHEGNSGTGSSPAVTWVEPVKGGTELDVLRAVAVARIAAGTGARIGVDWSQCGLELAQVTLGFGASDLRGPITRKSGLPIYEDEKLKVKGQGMMELRSIKKREIAALVTHAGRLPVFVDDDAPRAREPLREAAQNV
jgi:hypothetical protein